MKRGLFALVLLTFIVFLLSIFSINFVMAQYGDTPGYNPYSSSSSSFFGLSISDLISNEWFNAAVLFLLVFAVCWFVLLKVFSGSKGAAIIVSVVIALMGSMGTIYFYGLILPKLATWLVVAIFVAIALILTYQLRRIGMAIWLVMAAVALFWLLWANKQLCPPLGFLPQEVCVILDTIAFALLIIIFIRLLAWLIKKVTGTIGMTRGGGGGGYKPPKPSKAPPGRFNLTIGVQGNGTTNPRPGNRVLKERARFGVRAISGTNSKLHHWELDGTHMGASNVINVTMNSDHTLVAVFEGVRQAQAQVQQQQQQQLQQQVIQKKIRTARELQHAYNDYKFKIFNTRYNPSNRTWMLNAMKIIAQKAQQMNYTIKGPSPNDIEAKLRKNKLI